VKVLARGISVFRAAPEEKEAVLAGNMLVVTAFPPTVKRTTRETALERNRLALALAEERCIPWVDEESPLKNLASGMRIQENGLKTCRHDKISLGN
jgi:predicted Rossmann fold nucleotide-binding protein DprA/Smf involved in DNA uptake